MEFRNITDIKQCRILWEKFSPKKSVWDIWEIASAFNIGAKAQPLFILGIKNGKEAGILHLEEGQDRDGEWCNFFGGEYPERRVFYINDKNLINEFLKQAPKNALLEFIDPSEIKFVDNIKESGVAYSINLVKYNHDIEKYFSTFGKKHLKNLRNDMKKLNELKYSIVINKKEHLTRLIELNLLRFKEDSDFTYPDFLNGIKILVNNADKLGVLQLLSIEINGKVEACQIALFYNKVYVVLTGGSNMEIANLGKLIIIEHIKNAILLKADAIDFMTGDCGWKKIWNLEETMLYEFEK